MKATIIVTTYDFLMFYSHWLCLFAYCECFKHLEIVLKKMPNILATQRKRNRNIDISLLRAYNQEPVCFVSEEVEDKKICIIPLDSSWCYLI